MDELNIGFYAIAVLCVAMYIGHCIVVRNKDKTQTTQTEIYNHIQIIYMITFISYCEDNKETLPDNVKERLEALNKNLEEIHGTDTSVKV